MQPCILWMCIMQVCVFDLVTSICLCHQWGEIQTLLGSGYSQPEVRVSNSLDKSGSKTPNFCPLIVKFVQSGCCRCRNEIHRCLMLGEKYLIDGVWEACFIQSLIPKSSAANNINLGTEVESILACHVQGTGFLKATAPLLPLLPKMRY